MLAPPYPLRLVSPSDHANTTGNFPGGRRLCLRRPPRYSFFLRRATPTRSHFSQADAAFVCAALPHYALFLHRATPTRPGFSRADAAFVGVPLPAVPYFFVSPRQHRLEIP